MAKMMQNKDGDLAVILDLARREVAITISKDGEVGVATVHTMEENAVQEMHSWLAEGIAKALTDADMFEELRLIAQRAHGMAVHGLGDEQIIGDEENVLHFPDLTKGKKVH